MSRDYSSKKVLRENAYIYNDYYRVGIIDGWAENDKEYNFRHLLKIAERAGGSLKNASVLDIGCGTGDIVPTLRANHVKRYMGVDIYKPALRIAKRKYPKETFLHLDILKSEPSSSRKRGSRFPVKPGMTSTLFDFVLSSGALSIKLKSIDNYVFLESMVKRMWQMTRKGLSFNVLTTEDVAPAKHLFYYDIETVRKICKEIAPNAKVGIRRTPIFNGEGYEDEAQIHVYITPLSLS